MTSPLPTPLSYKDAGVDIDAGDALVDRIKPLAKKTLREGVLAGIGGFGALFEVPKRYKEPVLVSGTDGVGTKLKLAFEWNMHDTVGIDLVAMSVNDVLVQGAEPLFFLDYFACGKLDVDTAAAVVGGIARGCELSGCALIGGETAEMPGMYPAGEYDLAGFAVGAVEKSKILTGQNVKPGDVVLGLASAGVHSNGFSLVRKVIERAGAELPAALAARLTQTQLRQRSVSGLNGVLQVQVPAGQCALLTIDGKVDRLLQAGSHAFWKFGRSIAVELVDLRLQAVEVSGQDIMTRDKVSLRLNLSATYRHTDVLRAFAQLQKPAEHLYRELQFALRAAVGTRTLDELLENKTVIDDVVTAHMAAKLQPFGMVVESVGVKDIVLPGEMKAILTQVVQAEKQAQANVIRRREETAATRSLLNTAKVMEDNPVALRMKELETLERVAERIDKISVFGGLDQVLNGLVKMR